MPSKYLMIKGSCVHFWILTFLILFLNRLSKPCKNMFSIYLHMEMSRVLLECLQIQLQTSPRTPQKSYEKFQKHRGQPLLGEN